jgi:hypothetical protein
MSDELHDLLDDVDLPDDEEIKEAVDDDEVEEEEEEEEEKTVPLAALKDERSKRQNIEAQLELYRAQLQNVQNQQPKEKDPFDELDDDELMTKEQLVKRENKTKAEIEQQMGQLVMMHRHPDYKETVDKYLPEMIKQDPDYYDMIVSAAPGKQAERAYKIATMHPDYKKASDKQDDKKIKDKSKKVIKNSKKVKSPSSVVGSSGGVGNKWTDASFEDILKYADEVIEKG